MGSDRVRTETDLSRSLARWNAVSFATVFAGLAGGVVGLTTMAVLALGAPPRYRMLELLAQYFPGYALTPAGAVAGLFWAALFGFVLALPTAWIYYRGVLRQIARSSRAGAAGDPLRVVARIDVPHFALAFGLLSGLTLALATVWLLLKHQPGEPLGPRLALVGEYFPGYRVSPAGALIGFLYATAAGAFAFAAVGRIYNRLIASRPTPGAG